MTETFTAGLGGEGADVHDAGAGEERPDDAASGVDQPARSSAPAAHGSAEYGQEFLDLERELSVFLRRARASSGEMARQVHPDLEPSAYGLLVRLEDAGPQRATTLAGYFGVGKATMSRQLRALEGLGLVARTPDPADGRAWLLHLTEEGRARFSRVRGARRERYGRQLGSWDRTEITELARLLHRLNSLWPDDEST
jgi:DNA-binding MarR family transcriptional regulator